MATVLAFSQPTLSDKVHELTSVLPKLAERDVDFACKIVAFYNKRKTLSDGYMPWVQKLIDRANGIVPAQPQATNVGDLSGLIGLFKTAGTRLKWPKITLTITGKVVILSMAGERSKAPGSINIKGPGAFGESPWYGRVSPTGQYDPSRSVTPEFQAALVALLTGLSTDPFNTVQKYGKLTGQCMFCLDTLGPREGQAETLTTRRSVAAGMGEKCSKNWGLHEQWKQAAK
jgi:hypothetical protein